MSGIWYYWNPIPKSEFLDGRLAAYDFELNPKDPEALLQTCKRENGEIVKCHFKLEIMGDGVSGAGYRYGDMGALFHAIADHWPRFIYRDGAGWPEVVDGPSEEAIRKRQQCIDADMERAHASGDGDAEFAMAMRLIYVGEGGEGFRVVRLRP